MKSLEELMDIKNRVAVITGSAGNIGFAIAQTLAELGAHIVLLDINKAKCDENAEYLTCKYRIKTLSLKIDLSKENLVRSAPRRILKKFGRIDILVNCAALIASFKLKGWTVELDKQNINTWRKALEVNLTSPFALIQSCRKALAASGHGSVINIGSIYGIVGPDMKLYKGTAMGNPAAYAASKGGLIQLTRYLATVFAPDIRVNAISPGGVFRNHKEPFLSRYVERTPLKRMAKEEDLKGAVAYLASDLSAYVTGHNLVVDGGWTVW